MSIEWSASRCKGEASAYASLPLALGARHRRNGRVLSEACAALNLKLGGVNLPVEPMPAHGAEALMILVTWWRVKCAREIIVYQLTKSQALRRSYRERRHEINCWWEKSQQKRRRAKCHEMLVSMNINNRVRRAVVVRGYMLCGTRRALGRLAKQ